MSFMDKTFDNILKGKIKITQFKSGFRFGFDTIFLAAFVNGFLKQYKKKDISLADVGSGVGSISLVIAFKNIDIKITAIENNVDYLKTAEENIINNNFQKNIELINSDIFNINKKLINHFDIVVTNPPFYNKENNKSKNKLKDVSKRMIDLNRWLECSVKLLKDKGIIFLIFPTEILDKVLISLSKKTGSFKIFPFWPNQKKASKRIILYAIKGGSSPTELMPGLKIYNNNGVITKKAKLISEEGIFRFL